MTLPTPMIMRSPLAIGIDLARGLGSMQGQFNANRAAQMANRFSQATQADKIAAINAQNQGIGNTAAQQYQANLARTQAQTQAIMHPKTPESEATNLLGAYKQAVVSGNTQLANLYASKLNPKKGMSLSTQPGGGMSLSMGGAQGNQVVPYVDAQGNPVVQAPSNVGKLPSRGGMFQTVNHPDGTSTVVYSPTTASRSALQQIQGAQKEIEYLQPKLIEGFGPYQGSGVVQLGKDLFNPSVPTARKRIVNYLAVKNLLVEGSALRARLAGTKGGEEIINRYDATFGNLPPSWMTNLHTLPKDIINDAQRQSVTMLKNAAQVRIAKTGGGLHVNMPTSQVPGFLASKGLTQQQQQPSSEQGNYTQNVPQAPSVSSGTVKMRFPDGSIKVVPHNQVQQYSQWGHVVNG